MEGNGKHEGLKLAVQVSEQGKIQLSFFKRALIEGGEDQPILVYEFGNYMSALKLANMISRLAVELFCKIMENESGPKIVKPGELA